MAFLIGKAPCAFLVVIWLATVITLALFCVIEIRTLRLMKNGGSTASAVESMSPILFSPPDHESGDSPLVALLLRIRAENEERSGIDDGREVSLMNTEESIVTNLEHLPTEPRDHLIIHVGPR